MRLITSLFTTVTVLALPLAAQNEPPGLASPPSLPMRGWCDGRGNPTDRSYSSMRPPRARLSAMDPTCNNGDPRR